MNARSIIAAIGFLSAGICIGYLLSDRKKHADEKPAVEESFEEPVDPVIFEHPVEIDSNEEEVEELYEDDSDDEEEIDSLYEEFVSKHYVKDLDNTPIEQKPFIIQEEQYGEYRQFKTVELYYHIDEDRLVDEDGYDIESPEYYISNGVNLMRSLDYKDELYVRNPELYTDYHVCKVCGSYAD